MPTENIEPIYSELQGYLTEAPKTTEHDQLYGKAESAVWQQVNTVIQLLEQELDTDLSRFKIQTFTTSDGKHYISLYSYRQKLGGLIAYLHRQHFKHEPPPFPNMPATTIINQTQSQQVDIQLMLDLRGAVEKALPQTTENSPERGFLEKIKETMGTADTGMNVLSKVMKAANESGLSLEAVRALLGL